MARTKNIRTVSQKPQVWAKILSRMLRHKGLGTRSYDDGATHHRHTLLMTEYVYCGYIKAKFPIKPWIPLGGQPAYYLAQRLTRPRVTENFIYISLGHKDIQDNEYARFLLQWIAQHDGKVTRLDFYVDYLGTLDFDVFYALHDNDKRPTPQIVKSPSGVTVYVGKRSSARMLRIYDKRGEILAKKSIDIGFALTRIELEIKRGMVSRYLALFMSKNTLQILQDIQSLYGLHGFCVSHAASKPFDAVDKTNDCFAFVQRFKRIIREAYLTDSAQFYEILGVN